MSTERQTTEELQYRLRVVINELSRFRPENITPVLFAEFQICQCKLMEELIKTLKHLDQEIDAL